MLLRKLLDYFVKIGSFVIILEPLWMLLPFAGFLYGSVLNLEFLKNSPHTVWLLYFIFPVQTLMPLSVLLIAAGLFIFIGGAFQVYTAKIRKSGMVKTGFYKKFRNPQYTGLVLFAIGFLLMWGRFIAWIAFFLMVFVYYFLAKKEENICLMRFGREYEDYMKTTYFLFPGETIFPPLGRIFSTLIPQTTLRRTVSFVLLMGISISICFSILSIREITTESIPFSKKTMTIDGKDIKAIIVTGFKHHIEGMSVSPQRDPFGAFLSSLEASPKMRKALTMMSTDRINTLFCFPIRRTVREKRPYYEKGYGDIFMMLLNTPIALKSRNFREYRNNWDVQGALEVNEFDMAKTSKSDEPIKGEIFVHKPFEGESFASFQKRMEGILNIYLTGLKSEAVPIN